MITEVKLTSMSASGEAGGSRDTDRRIYVGEYRAKSNNRTDTGNEVLDHFKNDPDLPYIDDSYRYGSSVDGAALCNRIYAEKVPESDPIVHVVRVTWQTFELGQEETQPDKNNKPSKDPLQWVPRIETTHRSRAKDAWEMLYLGGYAKWDAIPAPNGPPFVRTPQNSAEVPYDPPVQCEEPILVVQSTRFFKLFNATGLNAWMGRVNAEWFGINLFNFIGFFPKYTCKITAIDSGIQRINGGLFHEVRTEFEYIDQVVRILDHGLHARRQAGDDDGYGGTISTPPPGTSQVERVKDVHHDVVNVPVKLDGNGGILGPGEPEVFGRWLCDTNPLDYRLFPMLFGIIDGT